MPEPPVCFAKEKKKRSHRRTCADDGNTDREILPKIVCKAPGRVRDFG